MHSATAERRGTANPGLPPNSPFNICTQLLALAVAVCFALYRLLPEPPPPPPPPVPFLTAIFEFVSGKVFADIGRAIGEAIGREVAYEIRFAILSTIGFLCALTARRHFKSAKWFAFANLPGTILLVWALIAEILESAKS
ncbi:MAG: hypothetical protein WD669_03460 [Pirellulales bacterium]